MTRRVQPDDPPLSRCGTCGTRYSPYGHAKCPECDGYESEEPCLSIDCYGSQCPTEEAREAWESWTDAGPSFNYRL